MPAPNIMLPISYHGDEYYTLRSDAELIADNLIRLPLTVWCPFNDTQSVWADVLTERGYKVVTTDTDFFKTEPPDGVQCVISNPPFSRKQDVLERLKQLNLRFALILPFLWLNDGVPLEYGHQLMFFRKRIHFNTPEGVKNKPRCNCFVLSDGLLQNNMTLVGKEQYENHTKL